MPLNNYSLAQLLKRNRTWAAEMERAEPSFFHELAKDGGPRPHVLWIGCSDSRMPANTLLNLRPGDVFVHRNVANQFINSDFNALSALQFAVDILKVREILVVGHYDCSGVAAAAGPAKNGLVDNWIRHVRDIYLSHAQELAQFGPERKLDRLVELNAIRQAINVALSTVIQNAWVRDQYVAVHGLVYSLHSGRLLDLDVSMSAPEHVVALHSKFHQPNGLREHRGQSAGRGRALPRLA